MTAEEILRAAAERLRTKGWCQGSTGGSAGPNCLEGAIVHESFSHSDDLAARKALMLVTGCVHDFNDAHCRSKQDAIAALEIAADLAAPEWKP